MLVSGYRSYLIIRWPGPRAEVRPCTGCTVTVRGGGEEEEEVDGKNKRYIEVTLFHTDPTPTNVN